MIAVKSIDDFKSHEDTIIKVRGKNYKFRIDGDQCGTYGYWEGEKYVLMTTLLPDTDACTKGFSLEVLFAENWSSYGMQYDLNINVESFEEYQDLVETLGKSLIDKHDDVAKVPFTSPNEVTNYHSNVCDGELTPSPALLNFHCDKCGCIAEGNNLLVSRFFDSRKGVVSLGRGV